MKRFIEKAFMLAAVYAMVASCSLTMDVAAAETAMLPVLGAP